MMTFSRSVRLVLTAATAAALTACGGGGSSTPTLAPAVPAAPAAPAAPPAPAAGSNAFIVTNATVAARNGTYNVSSALGFLPAGNTNTDYNGNTTDGKFEWDVQYTAAGVVKSAYVWYYEAGNAIVFFGCNGGTIACTGVTYNPATKKVTYVGAPFPEITSVFPGPAALVPGGGSITVDGAVNVN